MASTPLRDERDALLASVRSICNRVEIAEGGPDIGGVRLQRIAATVRLLVESAGALAAHVESHGDLAWADEADDGPRPHITVHITNPTPTE